jgi:WD40 repeat protein
MIFMLLVSSASTQDKLDYHLLWQTGTGFPISIDWINDSEIRVRTTRSIDVLDVTLETRFELVSVANIHDGVTLGYESQYLTQAFRGEIWAWDALTEELRVFEDVGTTSALARRPQYNQLVVNIRNFVTQTEHLELWDIASGEILATFPEITNGVSALSWRPDGQKLAVGTDEGTIIYSVDQTLITFEQYLYSGPVNSLSWRVDNNLLAVSSFENPFFVLWDTTTYQPVSSVPPEGFRGQLEWNDTGQYLAGRLEDGAISVWDYENNNGFNIDYDISAIADYAWRNNSLAVLLRNGNIDIWDAESEERLASNFIYTGEVAGFAISPQTHRAAVIYQPSNTIHILDSTDGTEHRAIASKNEKGDNRHQKR